MCARPAGRAHQFIPRWLESAEIGEVLAAGPLIHGGIKLEVNLIEAIRQEQLERTESPVVSPLRETCR